MANNYTLFCEGIYLGRSPQEKEWVLQVLKNTCDKFASVEELKEFLAIEGIDTKDLELEDSWPNFQFTILKDPTNNQGECLLLFSEENCDLEHVRAFVTAYLKKFQPEMVFTLQWADTCSDTRVSGFSGGAMVVTATDYRMESTQALLLRLQDELQKGKSA